MGAIYSEPEKYTVSTQTPAKQNQLQLHGTVPPEVVREGIYNVASAKREKGGFCCTKNTSSAAESFTSTYEHNNVLSKEQSCGIFYSPKSERQILSTPARADHQSCSSDKRQLPPLEEKNVSQRVERRSTNERYERNSILVGEVSQNNINSRKGICKKTKQDESSQQSNSCYCVLDDQEELIKKIVTKHIKKLSKEMDFSQSIQQGCNLNKRTPIEKSNSQEVLRQIPPVDNINCKISIQREDTSYDGSQEDVSVDYSIQNNICDASKKKELRSYEEENGNFNRKSSSQKSGSQESLTSKDNINKEEEDNAYSCSQSTKKLFSKGNILETSKQRVSPKENSNAKSFHVPTSKKGEKPITIVPCNCPRTPILPKEFREDCEQNDNRKKSKQRELPAYDEEDEDLYRRPSTRQSPKDIKKLQLQPNSYSYSVVAPPNSYCSSSVDEENSQEELGKVHVTDFKQDDISKVSKQKGKPAYEEEDKIISRRPSNRKSCIKEPVPPQVPPEDYSISILTCCKTTKKRVVPPNMESNSQYELNKEPTKDTKQDDIICKTSKQRQGLAYSEDDENLCRRPSTKKTCLQEELSQVQPKQNRFGQSRVTTKRGVSPLNLEQNPCCCSSLEESNSQEQYAKAPTRDSNQHNNYKTSKQKAYEEEDENLCSRSSAKTSCLQEDLPQVYNDDRDPQLLGSCKTTKKEVAPPNMDQNSNSSVCIDEAKSQDSQLDDSFKILKQKEVPTYEKECENVCRRLSKRISCGRETEVPPNDNINSKLQDSCKTTKKREPYQSVQRDNNSGRSKQVSLRKFEAAMDNSSSESNICNTMEQKKKMPDEKDNLSQCSFTRKSSMRVSSKCSIVSQNIKTNEKKENLPKVEQDVKFCNCPIKRDNLTSSKVKEFEDSISNFASVSEVSSISYHSIIDHSIVNTQKLRNEVNSAKSSEGKNQCSKSYAYLEDTDVLNSFELECLNEHNRLRALHNCPPLTLNPKLSKLATNWAINISRSKTIRRDDGNKYGENMYISVNMNVNGATPVKSWYTEISKYNFENPCFHPNSGHFTQVIWKDTKQIGVGIATKDKSTWVVVYYNPPGNLIHKFKLNVPPLANNYEEID